MALKKVDVNEVERQRAERNKELARRADESYAYSVKRRHRYERHRAVGLLSRGVALILTFIVIMFSFNFFGLQTLGSQTVSVISTGSSFDGSDVTLTKFSFRDEDGAFSLVERAFVGIANLCDSVSSFFGYSFGLDNNYVYFLYESLLDSPLGKIPVDREFVIAIRYDSNTFEPKREILYSSVEEAVFFSVSIGSPYSVPVVALYDINGDLLKRFYAVPSSVIGGGGTGAHFEYWKRFKTYPLALKAGFDWVDDYTSQPFPQ